MLSFLVVYLFLGAFAGVLAGLLGLGGGLVLVPLLNIAFDFQGIPKELNMHMALGTSLASIIFTSIASAKSHHKNHAVDWTVLKNISLGIIIGTYVGSFVAAYLPAHYLQLIFAFFLFYVTSQMILNKKPNPTRHMPGFIGTNSAGVGIGFISSLVGIGGGTLSVPFMIWHNIDIKKAIGTSAAIGFPIALAGALGFFVNGMDAQNLPQYSLGFIYLPALAGIVVCSMLTAPIGANLTHRLPVTKIKKIFSLVLIIVAIRMLITAIKQF